VDSIGCERLANVNASQDGQGRWDVGTLGTGPVAAVGHQEILDEGHLDGGI